jgi:hypothetical protein
LYSRATAIIDLIDAKVSIDTIVQWIELRASGLIAVWRKAACMSEKKTAVVIEESASERCAVIVVRRNEVFYRRFVIASCEKESLRELFAAPGAIGIGFSFHDAAADILPDSLLKDGNAKNIRHRIGFAETRRVACATLQHALAVGVLMFYSKNLLGSVIRAFVCA